MQNATVEASKQYLSKKRIPELLQSLTVGLLANEPDDHIEFLICCLKSIKLHGHNKIMWDSFLPADDDGDQKLSKSIE